MPEPTADLQALRASTADLLRDLASPDWTDDAAAGPSLCEGWTRGHVLTHLARNADAIGATLAGALRGEVVPRYPDGWAARDVAIEQGATRPFAALAADLRDATARLDRVLGAVGDAGAWDRGTDEQRHAHEWVFRRLREVEIHRVDLDHGYRPGHWPPLLVGQLLPQVAESLDERATGPLRVTVAAEGSLVPDLVGSTWTVAGAAAAQDGPTGVVEGPDWALLAWLIGRPAVAADALTAVPALGPWR